MITQGTTPAAPAVAELVSGLSARLGLDAPVRLLQSAHIDPPVAIGWLRPVVLLPTATVTGLTPARLEAILAHELAHVRRHDFLLLCSGVVPAVGKPFARGPSSNERMALDDGCRWTRF